MDNSKFLEMVKSGFKPPTENIRKCKTYRSYISVPTQLLIEYYIEEQKIEKNTTRKRQFL